MSNKDQIELIARGVCVKDGKLLLCHTKGADNTYLPGGHIDFKERACMALEREVDEELAVKAVVGDFLGSVEHSFIQKGEEHCEVNMIFDMVIDELDASKTPESKEDYIEFIWHPIGNLSDSGLEPSVLVDVLPCWLNADQDKSRWASTYA